MRALSDACLGAAVLVVGLAVSSSTLVACDEGGSAIHGDDEPDSSVALPTLKPVPFDVPIARITSSDLRAFNTGDVLFSLTLREPDGLGPLYTRDNCGGCHKGALRGPGLVQKMSIVEPDGVTPVMDQSALAFGHTVHPLLAAQGMTAILPPSGEMSVRVTIRIGMPVLGRGYMEAVSDQEIERVAEAQQTRDDDIHGRINHVTYASEPNPDTRFHTHQKGDVLIGRFGMKARIATLDDFAADALQGDMGITSPLRPSEIPNPDGLLDDDKPGVDVTADSVNARAMYTRLLAIPARKSGSDQGPSLFEQAKCAVCHVPSLHTRADYPIAVLADIDAPIYTDMLLHDMGLGLSDSLSDGDGEAGPRDWRTAPLLGLQFYQTFLHDGRAHSVEEAILAHESDGSEASEAVQLYRSLSDSQKNVLLDFVESL